MVKKITPNSSISKNTLKIAIGLVIIASLAAGISLFLKTTPNMPPVTPLPTYQDALSLSLSDTESSEKKESIKPQIEIQTEQYNTNQIAIEQLASAFKQQQQINHERISDLTEQIANLIQSFADNQHKQTEVFHQSKIQFEQINHHINRLVEQIGKLNATPTTSQAYQPPFDLLSVDLWDGISQAVIRFQGKMSIVNIGDMRLNWEIIDINFAKEQIIISNNGRKMTLEKVK